MNSLTHDLYVEHETLQISRGYIYSGYIRVGYVPFAYSLGTLFHITSSHEAAELIETVDDVRGAYSLHLTLGGEMVSLGDDEYKLFSAIGVICALHVLLSESDDERSLANSATELSLQDTVVFSGSFTYEIESGLFDLLRKRFACRLLPVTAN